MVDGFRRCWADTIGHSEKISSGQTLTDILNFHCDLDLECSNPIFPHDTPAYNTLLSNQVWMQKDQQYRRYSKNGQVLIISALAVTLTLKIVNQFYCKTHCLMIIHHHTEFGKKKKWLSGSGDTEQTWLDTWRKISGQTFTDILNLHCDVDLEHSNPIFPQDTGLKCCTIKPSLVANWPAV